jgi:hypothetical protein
MNRAVLVFEYRPKPCSEPQAAKALITRHAPDISCGQKRSAAQNKKGTLKNSLGIQETSGGPKLKMQIVAKPPRSGWRQFRC